MRLRTNGYFSVQYTSLCALETARRAHSHYSLGVDKITKHESSKLFNLSDAADVTRTGHADAREQQPDINATVYFFHLLFS